jgi:hypothetical protein
MAQDEMLLFRGRNRIRYGYARWGYTRGGGKTWHGGADVEGLDDTTIRMPGYGLGAGRHAISGTVVTARRVAQSTGNPTWEWGWYVCVKLDANQTPDAVNYLYFCHNAKNLAAVGQRVKTGDALAVMGNTGNAALASPPYAHCHFEVRATATGRGLNPAQYMGFENAVGTYGAAEEEESEMEQPLSPDNITIQIGPASSGDRAALKNQAQSLGLGYSEGPVDGSGNALVYIGPASAGDQRIVLTKAAELGLSYGIYTLPAQTPEEPDEPAGDDIEALRAELEASKAEAQALRNSLASMTAERDTALQQAQEAGEKAEAATERAEHAEAKIRAAQAALEG